MKKLLILTTALFFLKISIAFSQTEIYKRVKILTGKKDIATLSKLGIETDHGNLRKGVWLITDLSERELLKVQQAGFDTEVLIDDVKKYYREQLAPAASLQKSAQTSCNVPSTPNYPVPSHFHLGSMGGYFTYQEMLDNLDSMATLYPNLITIKAPIDTGHTIEGREVFYVKVSDNPNVNEPEPEMLYTGVHHAREPNSMSNLIYYLWYLLENYATDTVVQNIVNNTQLYFVPCINPDGYIYNQTTDPAGGGMWRKNRRDNLDGTFGIDLNRNYDYFWGFDNNGSSPVSGDETYRGTSGFSEPETQMIRNFVNQHTFHITLNYHSYGNLLIYPWGYLPDYYTPDSALFVNYGQQLTTYNKYLYGTSNQTVGYQVNGSSDDWMYGDQTAKPKILAMTPETGSDAFGFWPPSSEIINICRDDMYQNLTAAQLLGRYAVLDEFSENIFQQTSDFIKFHITQLGLDTSGAYTVSLIPVTSNILSTGTPKVFSSLSILQTKTDSISFSLNTNGLSNGDVFKFLLRIDNGQYITTDTITKYYGTTTILFSHNGNTVSGWNGTWGISNTVYYSPTGSVTDSPNGNYDPNSYNFTQMANPVNLINAVKATLSFYTRWDIEPNYDYAQVAVSVNGAGGPWIPLCGKYTKTGSGFQDPGEPVYDGMNNSWVKEEISLDNYIGQNIYIRFLLVSDAWVEYDGFYFDDLEITKIMSGGVGINEQLNTSSSITVNPVPADDFVLINFQSPGETKNSKVVVFDMQGGIVREMEVGNKKTHLRISTSNLSQGIYYLRIVSDNVVSSPVKFTVVH